jgi:putative FmdB family regulatory protein
VPTYGYRCENHHQFEVWQRISDPPLTSCPECGAPLHRVFYPVGIVFKGQGFYKTDSRGADSSASVPSQPAKDSAKEAGDSAKTAKDSTKASTESGSSSGREKKPASDSPADKKSA